MSDEPADDDATSFILEGLEELRGYTQQPPATPEQINVLLESFERHKKRLVVPAERVAEFEAAVRAATLGHAVTVVGHQWLEPGQAYLMASEAELEANMRAAIEEGMREQIHENAAAILERLRAKLEDEARREREREYLRAVYSMRRSGWFGVITGI